MIDVIFYTVFIAIIAAKFAISLMLLCDTYYEDCNIVNNELRKTVQESYNKKIIDIVLGSIATAIMVFIGDWLLGSLYLTSIIAQILSEYQFLRGTS